jgi:hypothetical protein
MDSGQRAAEASRREQTAARENSPALYMRQHGMYILGALDLLQQLQLLGRGR